MVNNTSQLNFTDALKIPKHFGSFYYFMAGVYVIADFFLDLTKGRQCSEALTKFTSAREKSKESKVL